MTEIGSVVLADGTQINDIPTAIANSIAYTSKRQNNESVVMNLSEIIFVCHRLISLPQSGSFIRQSDE